MELSETNYTADSKGKIEKIKINNIPDDKLPSIIFSSNIFERRLTDSILGAVKNNQEEGFSIYTNADEILFTPIVLGDNYSVKMHTPKDIGSDKSNTRLYFDAHIHTGSGFFSNQDLETYEEIINGNLIKINTNMYYAVFLPHFKKIGTIYALNEITAIVISGIPENHIYISIGNNGLTFNDKIILLKKSGLNVITATMEFKRNRININPLIKELTTQNFYPITNK